MSAPADRVYHAFIDPDALTRWLPPYGFVATMHEFTAEVGGGYRMSFRHLSTGSEHAFTVKFVELEPNKRIRQTASKTRTCPVRWRSRSTSARSPAARS